MSYPWYYFITWISVGIASIPYSRLHRLGNVEMTISLKNKLVCLIFLFHYKSALFGELNRNTTGYMHAGILPFEKQKVTSWIFLTWMYLTFSSTVPMIRIFHITNFPLINFRLEILKKAPLNVLEELMGWNGDYRASIEGSNGLCASISFFHKLCEKKDFHWPVFSRRKTES